MKTIVYIGGFELPDKNAAAQRVLANGKIFKSLGYNVVFLGVSKDVKHNSDFDVLNTKEEYCGFECWSTPYPSNTRGWLEYLTSTRHIKRLLQNEYQTGVAAIICYNYGSIALYRIMRLAKKLGVLYIPDATEWYAATGGNLFVKAIKWLDTTFRMRYVHHRCDGIIATSDYLGQYYKKSGCITVELPTLFDCDLMDQTEPIKTEEQNRTGIRLVYAGCPFNTRVVDRKTVKDRLDYVVDAILFANENETQVNLDIYGVSKADYLAYFPEHETRLDNWSKRIIFKGKVDRVVILGAIKAADFTIFLREIDRVTRAGFPTKFSESISSGTPVITNRISNIDSYLLEGRTGFSVDLYDRNTRNYSILEIMQNDKQAIVLMKSYCRKTRLFAYQNFVKDTGNFMSLVCDEK